MASSPALSRAPETIALVGISILAAILRFASLPSRGLIYWDEAKFALEGVRLQSGLVALVGGTASLGAGKAVGTAKPMHALLIALVYSLIGVHDYAPLFLNAAASVLQVVVLYFLARTLFGPVVAVVSALLLAVSEYDIVYARSALSESDGNLFFLLGLLLLARSIARGGKDITRTSLAAGVLMGLAFTVNYRLVVYMGVACLCVLVWAWHELKTFPWQGLLFLPGFVLLPILWQGIGLIAPGHGLTLFASELTGRPTSYFSEVVYQLHEGKQAAIHFTPVIYLQWYVLRQGWIASLLLLAGLVQTVRVRSAPWLVPAALVIVPYAVYVFAPFNVPRNLVAALPFASLLAAAALVRGVSTITAVRARLPIIYLTAALLAIIGSFFSWRLTEVRSGFVAAARYVRTHDSGRALTTTELMVFYLRSSGPTCAAPAMPLTEAGLAAAVASGYRYAITERESSAVTDYIQARAPMVARYLTTGSIELGESLISSENGDPPQSAAKPGYVAVYSLKDLPLPAAHAHTVRCAPNRVV
jgi:4-amino-4-deoxy-L-arabinose transferase-like glycosyltransferase